MSDLSNYSFEQIKKEYTRRRNVERLKIIEELLNYEDCTIMDMGFKKALANPRSAKAGRGLTDYTGNGTTAPYDLSNWQWINLKIGEHLITISLQPLETDQKTGNRHTLFDRIGLIYRNPLDQVERPTMITAIDLPLDEDKLDDLTNAINRFVAIVEDYLKAPDEWSEENYRGKVIEE